MTPGSRALTGCSTPESTPLITGGTCTATDWPAGSWAVAASGASSGPVTPGTDTPMSTGSGTAWDTAETTESRALPTGVPSSRPPLEPSGRWMSVLRVPPGRWGEESSRPLKSSVLWLAPRRSR